MIASQSKPLIVLEMANNHMGDLEHGIRIIRTFHDMTYNFKNFSFAFKFQYRDLDTFIHPDYKNNGEIKYVKRFSETRLTDDQFLRLKGEVKKCGFLAICTPFDNASVPKVIAHDYDIIKIASCSLTDWPLLEEISKYDLPTIVSTAGSSFDELDRVVSFLANRKKKFAVLHCVAEYPTATASHQLNQIDFLKSRYSGVTIGFSTHEDPSDTTIGQIAFAKGAAIFEKHIGLRTEKYSLNNYSADPEQFRNWLLKIDEARAICGGTDPNDRGVTAEATKSLHSLRRGAFVKGNISKGDLITADKVFFAIPNLDENQATANDFSKYAEFVAIEDIKSSQPVLLGKNTVKHDKREKIIEIMSQVKSIIKASGLRIPKKIDIEISHHYGIEKFSEVGCTILNFINREYCKKLIVCLPGQKHPEQYHMLKEEAFHVLHGEVEIVLDGKAQIAMPGDIIVVKRGVKHIFSSKTGAVIEEISSTHIGSDSYYTDLAISKNRSRKTYITYWLE